ncbi:hypothetical protein GOV11_04170 [Candidatus Woesearchaeota archaeon]|nr:hypothetical protein [Candidatus Woesearchaeota archaeon]
MIKFVDGTAYVLIPYLSVTQEMINRSTSRRLIDARISNEPVDVDRIVLFQVDEPIPDIFVGYLWYTKEEIIEELEDPRWG